MELPRKPVDASLRIVLVSLTALLCWVIAGPVREPHITIARDRAPDFRVTTERGVMVSLKEFRGRPLILNFWASWCVPCMEETSSLNALQQAYAPSGVRVLGISIDQDAHAYRTFLQKYRVAFETARDPGRKIPYQYGTFQIPETYVIDKSGVVAAKIISNRNWMDAEMINLIEMLR